MSKDLVIAKLDRAKQALAEARTIQDTKKILDIAAAAEIYARRQELGEDAINYAYEIKWTALGRLGELLRETPLAKGGAQYHKSTGSDLEPVLTLADIGLKGPEGKKISMIAQQLAALPEETRLAIAQKEISLTEAQRQQRKADRPAIELPKDIYRVLYADPPWQYSDTRLLDNFKMTAAEQNYPTMSVDELCALSVRDMAAPDAVLFCWATFPLLPDALTVVAAWGFKYKTAFVWKKPRGSFGHYHKADAELLLLATCGSCTPDSETRYSQVIEAPTEGHSVKPECVRTMIDTLYSHGPRIELFARRPAPGDWTTWGNEPE